MVIPRNDYEVGLLIEAIAEFIDDGDFQSAMSAISECCTFYALESFMPSRKLGSRKYSAQPLLRRELRPSSLGAVAAAKLLREGDQSPKRS